jgi:hypothetical protein
VDHRSTDHVTDSYLCKPTADQKGIYTNCYIIYKLYKDIHLRFSEQRIL